MAGIAPECPHIDIDGGAGSNSLSSGDGEDILSGGDGSDTLDGGAGLFDTAIYDASGAGVTVNLATGTGAGGEAEGDVLIGIENINGSFFADVLTGNDVANVLIGIGGDNELDGGAGNDELFGGDGFDAAAYVFATAGVTGRSRKSGQQHRGRGGRYLQFD